jgi:hypothetical protein
VVAALGGTVFALALGKRPVPWRYPAMIAAVALEIVLIYLMTKAHVWGLNVKA